MQSIVQRCVLLSALVVAALPAGARVTEIHTTAVEPFAGGTAFGEAGAYERVRGTYRGELDPADARNRVIVNLDKAPRNAKGLVEYEADFFILRPKEAARGNHKLIYDVTNRGRKVMHWRLMDGRPKSVANANNPQDADDTGNGLFCAAAMRWCGAAGIRRRRALRTACR